MEILGNILLVGGGIVCVYGSIWFLIVAFRTSILWGLGCLIVPFVSLVFLVMHWDAAGKPFLIQLAGLVPIGLGAMMME